VNTYQTCDIYIHTDNEGVSRRLHTKDELYRSRGGGGRFVNPIFFRTQFFLCRQQHGFADRSDDLPTGLTNGGVTPSSTDGPEDNC
jgi:hypothetical protein